MSCAQPYAQAVAHQRRAQSLRNALEAQETSSWREFQAVASVLVAAGALEAGTYQVRFLQNHTQEAKAIRHGGDIASVLQRWQCGCNWVMRHAPALIHLFPGGWQGAVAQATALGDVARQVSGENELWLATALTHAALQVGGVIGHQ